MPGLEVLAHGDRLTPAALEEAPPLCSTPPLPTPTLTPNIRGDHQQEQEQHQQHEAETEFVDERFTRAQPRLTYHSHSITDPLPAQRYRTSVVSLGFVTIVYSTTFLLLFQALNARIFGPESSSWQSIFNLSVPCVLFIAWAILILLVYHTTKLTVQCLWSIVVTLLALCAIASIASIASWLGPTMRANWPHGSIELVVAVILLLLVLFLMLLLSCIVLLCAASIVSSIIYVYQLEIERSNATTRTALNVFANRTLDSSDDC